MNRFSHSADHPTLQGDLHDVLEFSALLSRRTAEMHEITLVVDAQSRPVQLNVSLFHLINLIWLCLRAAIEVTHPGDSINLSLADKDAGLAIWIRPPVPFGKNSGEMIPENARKLADDLGMSAGLDADNGVIAINCC
jgi:hypothetical protein